MQQAKSMEARRRKGEEVEPNPASQLLFDLYTALEPHTNMGHPIIIVEDFNLQ